MTDCSDLEGLKLVLDEGKDGNITAAYLTYDLPNPDEFKARDLFIGYIRSFCDFTVVNKEVKEEDDGQKRQITLEIKNIRKPENLETVLMQKLKLVEATQQTLVNRLKHIDKTSYFPPEILDDIEFYTHLTHIPRDGKAFHLTVEDKIHQSINLTPLAFFLRDLYGVVQVESGVTRQQIYSNKKTALICEERTKVAFILRNKFPYLSTTNIGIIIGEIGKPKNHATVILALRKFDMTDFDKEIYYSGDPFSLYADATIRYNPLRKNKKECLSKHSLELTASSV